MKVFTAGKNLRFRRFRSLDIQFGASNTVNTVCYQPRDPAPGFRHYRWFVLVRKKAFRGAGFTGWEPYTATIVEAG